MTCVTGNKSLLLHAILLFDVFLYFFYALQEVFLSCCGSKAKNCCARVVCRGASRSRIANGILAFFLDVNLFCIFFISLLNLVGEDAHWGVHTAGVAVGALLGLLQVSSMRFVAVRPLYEFVFTSLLLMSAQLTNTYIPQLLSARVGVDLNTATALTLMVPVLVLYTLRAVAHSRLVLTLVICAAVSVLVVLCFAVYKRSDPAWMPDGEVCCSFSSNEDECPLLLTHMEMSFVVVLFFVIVQLRSACFVLQCVRACRRCICCCCCCRCCSSEDDEHTSDRDRHRDRDRCSRKDVQYVGLNTLKSPKAKAKDKADESEAEADAAERQSLLETPKAVSASEFSSDGEQSATEDKRVEVVLDQTKIKQEQQTQPAHN